MNADVMIVGAGPAGLEAAIQLSKAGKKVILLEKKHSMNELRRACSTQVILDDDYEGEGVVMKDNSFLFPKTGFHVPYHGKLIPVYNKYYHSPKNHTMRFATDDGKTPFSYKFDKKELLLEMYEECLQLGVDVRLQCLVKDAKDVGDHVEITMRDQAGETKRLTSQKLIDAEGVNAFVCGKLGFNKNRPHLATARCVKYIYKDLKGIEPYSWNLYYGQAYHSNAAIIIGPSLYGTDTFEVTITCDQNKLADQILEELRIDSPIAQVFEGGKILDKMGCFVKAFMPILNPCQGNVIIVGDAAAFVEVETQGALLCGYRAAKAVMEEFEGKDGFGTYTTWWQQSFEFNGPDYLKVSQGYALVPVYTDDELDYLFALAEKKCMPGTYSQYKTPAFMWENILSYQEQIKKERPEIYEKIKRLDQSSLKDSFKA